MILCVFFSLIVLIPYFAVIPQIACHPSEEQALLAYSFSGYGDEGLCSCCFEEIPESVETVMGCDLEKSCDRYYCAPCYAILGDFKVCPWCTHCVGCGMYKGKKWVSTRCMQCCGWMCKSCCSKDHICLQCKK